MSARPDALTAGTGEHPFVSVDLDGLADAVERVQEPLADLPGVDTVAPGEYPSP